MISDAEQPAVSPEKSGHRRLFFALEVTPDIRAGLGELCERLRKASMFTPLKASWVPPSNLHLTLYFLGNLPVATGETLARLLPEAAQSVPQFELDLRHIGFFPPGGERPPRVLWIGVHQPPAELEELRRHCASLLVRSGLAVPDQDFSPHITLARFKSTRGLSAFRAMVQDYRFFKAGKCPITRLVLMESITGKGPAKYVPYSDAELKSA